MKKFKAIIAMILVALIAAGSVSAASAVTANKSESEENGSFAMANEFTLSDCMAGAITSLSDQDFFKIKITKADVFNVIFEHDGAGGKINMYSVEIYDSAEKKITSFTVKGDAKKTGSPDFTAALDGTYYIKVFSTEIATGATYPISAASATVEGIDHSLVKPEIEVNDTLGEATIIKSSDIKEKAFTEWYHGAISEGDVDYYTFNVAVTGFIQFEIRNSDNSKGSYTADVVYTLGNGAANQVIGSIDIGALDKTSKSGDIGLKAGTYAIKVSGNNGSTGGYLIRIYIEPDANSESEYNDSREYANALANDSLKFASLSTEKDIDFFSYAANTDAKITVTPDKDDKDRYDPAGNWTVQLLDSNISVVTTVTVTADADATFDMTDKTGVYYIKVSSGSNYCKSNYIVKAQKAEPTKDDSDKSLIDRIKELDWKGFWKNNNFGDLLKNLGDGSGAGFLGLLFNLVNLSLGTLIRYFANRQAQS